jgi:hypothetical protein
MDWAAPRPSCPTETLTSHFSSPLTSPTWSLSSPLLCSPAGSLRCRPVFPRPGPPPLLRTFLPYPTPPVLPVPEPRTRSTAAAQDSSTREAAPPRNHSEVAGLFSGARVRRIARLRRTVRVARMAEAVRCGCCTPARRSRPPRRAATHASPWRREHRCSVLCTRTG